jgi:hypothetical protein
MKEAWMIRLPDTLAIARAKRFHHAGRANRIEETGTAHRAIQRGEICRRSRDHFDADWGELGCSSHFFMA